jgi:hypothetical protein
MPRAPVTDAPADEPWLVSLAAAVSAGETVDWWAGSALEPIGRHAPDGRRVLMLVAAGANELPALTVRAGWAPPPAPTR